ncbi:acyltransferase family protein [Novosphingobium sp.]|uniref:acyltransferase family protein n=1 Tax=Novosphingobium sp. TaxID=1874826 RepID=UPI003D15317E
MSAERRIDIQLLRALAIFLVVVHHTRLLPVPAGFLGVDIFFVISGYLMTGIIARERDQGQFSFGRFYSRRARRLLPSAYATLLVAALLAPILLDSAEYRDFVAQLAGAFGFVANIVLWKQANYFATGAILKPLLHLWSLGIEEQYYVVLPLAMVAMPARWWLAAMTLATMVSIAVCVWLTDHSPAFAFYMLPARFWELGIGSVVALALRGGYLRARVMPGARGAALAVLLLVPLIADERGHPGLPALAVTLATALLMIPGLDLRPTALLRPLVATGDRSYTLYLVHWPLLAFAANVWLSAVPIAIMAVAFGISLVWMELQYRLVERPFHHVTINMRALVAFAAVPVLVVGASALWLKRAEPTPDPAREYNFGLSQQCDLHGDFAFQAQCRTGNAPRLLVWGDSFAMQWVDGIAATAAAPIAQATRTGCGPFTGIAPYGAEYSIGWARRCADFNDSVITALAHAPGVHTVALSSSLTQYVPGAEPGWQMYRAGAGSGAQDGEALLASLARTVAAVRAMGKTVVLIAPPPAAGFDIARCATRLKERKPVADMPGGCDIPVAQYRHLRAPNLSFLAEVERRNIVPVYRFDPSLCHDGRCETTEKGTLLYRDSGHISIPGSVLLGRRLGLAQQLTAIAQ